MIYRFEMEGALRHHDVVANITVTPGAPGDLETPAEGPQIELLACYLTRNSRLRELRGNLSAEVEDYLVSRTPEIMDQWRRDSVQNAADHAFKRSVGE